MRALRSVSHWDWVLYIPVAAGQAVTRARSRRRVRLSSPVPMSKRCRRQGSLVVLAAVARGMNPLGETRPAAPGRSVFGHHRFAAVQNFTISPILYGS